ncbi:sodium-dependent transporter [Niveibacterium sp. 24ML]|uniref:sodium-dependent transporter n=1 Tax=Niveibacterium sp. 24ML TaxID=2985512 RepID=UPI0022707DD9|nr:sodium-dependent transporter [Niveibacterium sp. 24ML]MCX9156440.1 sodium-dependent transporter [Niveibacterium sp. 24ML]
MSSNRDGFSSTFGVLAATLGSAVGLGNIWKFPYLTGSNGGAGFLLVYLLATLLVGLPVMIAEIAIGRAARGDAVSAFERLRPGRGWGMIGVMGLLAALLIMAFYSEVAGWVFAYVAKAAAGGLLSSDPKLLSDAFGALVADPVSALMWQWVVLALVGGILSFGVSRGIEAVTKRLMPILFLLLVLICVRGLTLPGASAGLAFLFSPDFSKITPAVVLVAVGLAFFKLSIGMGTMVTYGSYFRADQNIPMTATRVMLADLTVSMLAGIAIFPAVFAFGFKPEAGPSLVFITIPAVFAGMPGGAFFMVAFFVLTAFAALGAMLSIVEVPVAVIAERFGLKRWQAALISVGVIGAVGSLAALSGSLTADWKLFGLNPFDLFDFVSSNLLLPAGGILIALFVGHSWGRGAWLRELSNDGALANQALAGALFVLVRWVSPVLIALVMLKGLGAF